MPLKRRIARLEDVAEKDRGYYVHTDDGYLLDLDGEDETATLKRTLDAERRQRAEATKKALALEERYKGIDPERVREEQTRLAELEDERLKAEGKYAELAERKYAKAMEAHEAEKLSLSQQLEKERADRAHAEKERADLIVRQQLESTLLELGADSQGIGYAVSIHLPKWSLGEDKKTPVQRDGDRVLMGPDPTKPLTMKEDLTDWVKKDKFAEKFFLPSTGGGANGNSARVNGGAVVITRADARDHAKYSAAKQQAEKAGVPLNVSP